MIASEPVALSLLLGTAATVGLVHTLAGPDHYLPVLVLGRVRRWGLGRLALATALLGVLHCAASAAVLWLLGAASAAWIPAAAAFSASLLVGMGLVLAVRGWRRRGRRVAIEPARGGSTAGGGTGALRGPGWALLCAAMLVGPCEWMIPTVLAAAAWYGWTAAWLVAGVYSAVTVATMVGAAVLGSLAAARLAPSGSRRGHGELLAGGVCAACGVLVLAGF
jgi:hypothetical protein